MNIKPGNLTRIEHSKLYDQPDNAECIICDRRRYLKQFACKQCDEVWQAHNRQLGHAGPEDYIAWVNDYRQQLRPKMYCANCDAHISRDIVDYLCSECRAQE